MVINRIKGIVLSLFAAYWLVVVVILVTAHSVFDEVGGLPSHQLSADVGAVVVLTVLLAFLSTGVVRGWRWTFWLILIVFIAGVRTVPIAALQLARHVPQQGPTWYVLFTALVGFVQFAIALAMLVGYRRSGVWGEW